MRRLIIGLIAVLIGLESGIADGDTITIASFQTGGSASYRYDAAEGMRIHGFGVGGDNLAYWGSSDYVGSWPTRVSLFSGATSGSSSRTDFVTPTGITSPQQNSHQAIAFDASGKPVITYTKNATGTQEATSVIVAYDPLIGTFRERTVAEDVSAPRYSAVAVDENERVAVYLGNDKPSETIVQDGGTLDRHSITDADGRPYSQFPGPLEFDAQGVLHQAIVGVQREGVIRDLHYLSRIDDGSWSDLIIDTESTGNEMTGNIDLALNLNDRPVIIGNSAQVEAATRDGCTLSIHELTDSGWQENGIFLNSVFGHFVAASDIKQLVFDSNGLAHVALLNPYYPQAGEYGEVAYLCLDSEWSVVESRTFDATAFYGLGVNDAGEVFIGYASPYNGGGGGEVPAPSSLVCLVGIGVMVAGMEWWKKRRHTRR